VLKPNYKLINFTYLEKIMLKTQSFYTISSQETAQQFGKVTINNTGQKLEINLTILKEPSGQEAEGWKTGVALDASASMRNWYGRMLLGKIPEHLEQEYQQKGWIELQIQDGKTVKIIQSQAYEDGIKKGYLQMSNNIIQPLAQQFISYLAGNLDINGGTTVIYWAGGNGAEIEVLGDFAEQECQQLIVNGANQMTFGLGTNLTPALSYFVERFKDVKRGMYVFLTDGKIDDLAQVKIYTIQLAKDISRGKQNPIKCVLIGVGEEIDEAQMIELDDLDTGTDIDIWDHKIAQEMRGLVEIFAEVVDENQIVASTGIIYDFQGNLVKKYTDGLPAKISFSLPVNSQGFILDVAGQKIKQKLIFP
jgi:hypothetical protein